MLTALKVLIIEDSPADAELAVAALTRAWPSIDWQRIETAQEFDAALASPPDVIVADYEVPGFGALAALRVLQQRSCDIPLIVFTGAVSEEIVVRCMQWGAADYLLKDRLTRLGPAIVNALNMKRERDEKRQTEREQQHLAALNRALLDSLPAHAALLDKHGHIIAINEAWRRDGNRLGFSSPSWGIGTDYPAACAQLKLQHADAIAVSHGIHAVLSGVRERFVHEYSCHSDARRCWYRIMVTPVYSVADEPSDGGAVVMHLDVTDRKLAEEQLNINSSALQHLTEGVAITDRELRVVSTNTAYIALTGYETEEVLGLPLSTVITGEETLDLHNEAALAVLLSGGWRAEVTCRRRDGGQFPAILSISAVRNEHGDVEHYTAVLSDLSSLRDVEQRIEYLAGHDALTGLPNRAALEMRLRTSIAQPNPSAVTAILLIELDRFKSINDSLGHRAGDAVIRAVAERLDHIRHPDDFLTRLGGDEFALLHQFPGDQEELLAYAESIRALLEGPFTLGGRELFITASIGIGSYPQDGVDAEAILRAADAAVYQAKESGRNAVALNSPLQDAAALERFVLQNSLPQALAKKQFALEYQPVVDLGSGTIIGVEALLRWHHPQLGLIGPNRFIGIAEDTGLILPISDWVLDTACRQIRQWQLAGWSDPSVAVNLSTREFVRRDLPQRVAAALQAHRVQPQQLTLELTESMVMSDPASAAELINELAEMGVKVALDDFGTGYSSLAYLRRFRVACLKVDRSFVSGAGNSSDDESIVRVVIALGKTLDMKIVAEGVETLEQANFLRQSGCDNAQGFFYSRPVAAERIPTLLHDIPQRFLGPDSLQWYGLEQAGHN